MPEPTVNFNLRLPEDLDAAIREYAEQNNRSINATLVAWLYYALHAGVTDPEETEA